MKAKRDVAMINFRFVNVKYLRDNIMITLVRCSFAVPSVPSSSTHTVKFIGNAIEQF